MQFFLSTNEFSSHASTFSIQEENYDVVYSSLTLKLKFKLLQLELMPKRCLKYQTGIRRR